MQNLWAFVVAWTMLVTSASAQDVSSLPSCGVFCVNNATAIAITTARCNQDHSNCYCKRGGFQQSVIDCADRSCPAPDVPQVTQYAKDFCANVSSTEDSPVSTKTVVATPASSVTSIAPPSSSTASAIPAANPDLTPNLTTGAKVGIGVGVPVAFLAMCGLTFFLWNQRRREERKHAAAREGMDAPEFSGSLGTHQSEVGGRPVYEMPGKEEAPPSYTLPPQDYDHARSGPILELPGDGGRTGEYTEKGKPGDRAQELE